ncbi:DUF4190 domain-containing protein [Microbacterium kunmingense]|uniref:DUF4190 domain-containing protein n=1 Tax=Microbacterium kunmingense TaxID=2915939 RepID=UPI0020057CEE|nr:DUF4190 domain-containing protein [Microbacterium kunmingense]
MTDPQNPSAVPPSAPQNPPAYSSAPPPAYNSPPAPGAPVPGKTLGIVAFVLSIVLSWLALIPLILGIVALVQSRKAGRGNGWAVAAIVISALSIIVTLIIVFALVIPSLSAASTCVANPDAIVNVWGVQVPCSEVVTTTP